MHTTPFIHFLGQLQDQALVLSARWVPVTDEERPIAEGYLQAVYAQEALEYPHQAPAFDAVAARWAAELVYHAAQLLFHRGTVLNELEHYFVPYTGIVDAGAILSADLSLRFVPLLLDKLKELNSEDFLLDLLQKALLPWHYALIGTDWRPALTKDWSELDRNPCLHQLYTDRVIMAQDLELASVPVLYHAILASLGDYIEEAWPSFAIVEPRVPN